MREVCLRCSNGEKAIADKPPSKDICATYFMTRGNSRRPHHRIYELNIDLVGTGDVIPKWWGNDPRFYRRGWYSKSRCVKSFQASAVKKCHTPESLSNSKESEDDKNHHHFHLQSTSPHHLESTSWQAWYLHRTLTKSCHLERSWLIQLVGCLRQWSWSCSGQRGSASKSSANDIRGSLCKLTKIKGLTFGQRDLRN